jgi:hypothetical protein
MAKAKPGSLVPLTGRLGAPKSCAAMPKYQLYLRVIVDSPTFWFNRFMAA